MPKRRLLLALPLALPLGAIGCATPEEPVALAPLVTGYRHLTPLRLNVLEITVPQGSASPAGGAARVPDAAAEMRRMAQERLVAVGTQGSARFIIATSRFTREPLPASGGLSGLFSGEPGERLSTDLLCRLELLSAEGERVGFVEAGSRRSRSLPDGTTPAARQRAAEEMLRQAMEELNVEFEYQIRRVLRAWLVEGEVAPPAVEREDLPASPPRS
jgi:hypothetical protein